MPFLSQKLPAYEKPLGEPSRRDTVNYFLPYDVGIADKKYERLYDVEVMSIRAKYLNDKLDRINNDKDMSIAEKSKSALDILMSYPKVFEQMKKQ
jgi:hypothetical protein